MRGSALDLSYAAPVLLCRRVAIVPSGTYSGAYIMRGAGGTPLLPPNGSLTVDDCAFRIDREIAISRLRLKANLFVDNVAPGISFSPGLYPVATIAGTNAACYVNGLGTLVQGSQVTFTTPTGGPVDIGVQKADFLPPGPGLFGLGVVMSGTISGSSFTTFVVELWANPADS